MNNHQFFSDYRDLPHDLIATIGLVYGPIPYNVSEMMKEIESEEYSAYSFQLNENIIRFRVAKTTPTKVGQFVTLWKREGKGPIQPYDNEDPFDFFVIATRKDDQFGQFVFPKSVLCKHDIVSVGKKGGKRAIRVYPPWEKSLNKQAQKSQCWQVEYFLDLSNDNTIDYNRVQSLYSKK